MDYKKFHDDMYKSWLPEHHKIRERSTEGGVLMLLSFIVAVLMLIFC